jgi:hypothetical protein
MKIEEIANIIEESSRKMAEEEGSDECCNCCKDHRDAKEFLITTLGNLLDRELYELGSLMFDIGEAEFGSDEEKTDRTDFYEKLDGAYKPLKAIRKLAEIKRYLEAQNNGEIKASVDASYKQEEI